MEFNYARFTEEWAEIYKPMRHIPGEDSTNRRFYICNSYLEMTQFVEHGMDPEVSPSVVIESQQDGIIENGWDYPRYSFYFMVRADEMNNGASAIEAKSEAKRHMMEFVNFIRMFKYADEYGYMLEKMALREGSYLDSLRTAVTEMGDRCLENLDIESVVYESINQMFNGWYAVQITLSDQQLLNKCANMALYGS